MPDTPIPIDDSGPDIPFAKMTAPRRPALLMPPQALDVEDAVLGALLIDGSAAGPVFDVLLTDDAFYGGNQRVIAAAIRALHTAGSPIDLISVSEQMRADKTYEQVGGHRLADLTTRAASSANAEYHARIVAEKHLLRLTITSAQKAARAAYDPGADPFDVLDALDADVWAAQKMVRGSTLRRPSDVLDAVMGHLDGSRPAPGLIASTGFPALDEVMGGGFWAEAMHVFSAASGTGKTTLGLGFTEHVGVHQQKGVAYFSVEVGAAKLTARLLGMLANVRAKAIRDATLSPVELADVQAARLLLARARIFFDDTPRLHIEQLETKARRLVQHEGVEVIIVDYLQRVGYDGLAKDLERGTSIVSGRLKALARELGVPVIAFSQVTKGAGQACKKGERPGLNDLRGSEDVGNDADSVGTIYRPAAYGLEYDELLARHTRGWAEVPFPKVRDGPQATAMLGYSHSLAKFTSAVPFDMGAAPAPEPDLF